MDNSILFAFILFVALLIAGIIVYFIMMQTPKKQSGVDQTVKLYSEKNNSIVAMQTTDANCNLPLCKFNVFSGFNCCNTGTMDDGFCSTAVLQAILKTGVRFLDFQIFSVEDQPAVSSSTQTSYTIKESINSCPFINVMEVISTFAFSCNNAPNCTDPIFIYFRFFSTNQKMYQNLATLLQSYDYLLLGPSYSFQNSSQNLATTPLINLLGKVVIIVDGTNNSFMDCQPFCEYVNMASGTMSLRCLNYNQVLNSPDLHELQNYNCLNNMTIVLPDIKAGTPENPNGNVCQEAGCNFTAMMFNINDGNFQNNMQFFNKNGSAFALKPTCQNDPSSQTVTPPIPQTTDVSTTPRNVETAAGVTFQV